MSEDPISGRPCWMTSYPVLREIPSDLNYKPTVSHPVDHLENGGEIYISTSTLSLEKMVGKSKITFIQALEELMTSH